MHDGFLKYANCAMGLPITKIEMDASMKIAEIITLRIFKMELEVGRRGKEGNTGHFLLTELGHGFILAIVLYFFGMTSLVIQLTSCVPPAQLLHQGLEQLSFKHSIQSLCNLEKFIVAAKTYIFLNVLNETLHRLHSSSKNALSS